jgi:cytochrome P450
VPDQARSEDPHPHRRHGAARYRTARRRFVGRPAPPNLAPRDRAWQAGRVALDLGARDVNADPDAFAARVLAEGGIQWSDVQRAWLLLSHVACSEGFRDPRLSSDRTPSLNRLVERRGEQFRPAAELLAGWMVFRDPPVHTRLREPVWRAFTPRTVARLVPAIEETVTALCDRMEELGTFDFKTEVAGPLPALIIADLLGVPRSEQARFQAWSDDLGEIVFSVDAGTVDEDRVVGATDEFISFFSEIIEHRRRHPGDDLISTVVQSSGASTGELTDLEIVGACTLLLFGGHETTTNLLTSSVRTLFDHPEEARRLATGEVSDTAADELMRVAGPAKSMVRKVGEAHDRDGHAFEVGQRVYLVILTANRDPAVFEAPERVDLGRNANLQLGFGWGMHLCLGANLARREVTTALEQVYRRFPGIAPAGDAARWSGNPLGRSLRTLPVTVR